MEGIEIQLQDIPHLSQGKAATDCTLKFYLFIYISLESFREKVTRKPKRLARSQIPTKPVEMPGGIDSLDVQVLYMLNGE